MSIAAAEDNDKWLQWIEAELQANRSLYGTPRFAEVFRHALDAGWSGKMGVIETTYTKHRNTEK